MTTSSLRVNLAGSDDLYYRIDAVTGQNGPRPGNPGVVADGTTFSTTHTLMFAVSVSAQGLTRELCDEELPEPPVGQLLTVSVDESLGTLAISVEPGDDPHLQLELAAAGDRCEGSGTLRPDA